MAGAGVLVAGLILVLPAAAQRAAAPREVSAWLPWWDQQRGFAAFEAHAASVAALSPVWYELQVDGQLASYPGAGAADVIGGTHKHGARLIPTISNAADATRVTAVLATDQLMALHIAALVSLAHDNGYDGIDIDYESMRAADRDRFSLFITRLAAALHAQGRWLTVAVHPKTSEPGDWSGAQAENYAAIGAAADRVRVMAYDYSSPSTGPGPVAPLGWVRRVVAFASRVIPAAKVELGVPLYGYDWPRGGGGSAVTFSDVRSLHRGLGHWEPGAAEHHLAYTAKDGMRHDVWFADGRSVAARQRLARQFGLAGVAFWRVGGEDPDTWADGSAEPSGR